MRGFIQRGGLVLVTIFAGWAAWMIVIGVLL